MWSSTIVSSCWKRCGSCLCHVSPFASTSRTTAMQGMHMSHHITMWTMLLLCLVSITIPVTHAVPNPSSVRASSIHGLPSHLRFSGTRPVNDNFLGYAACDMSDLVQYAPIISFLKRCGRPVIIYSTSSLFNTREQTLDLKLNQVLEQFGIQVFLPQRNGFQASKLQEVIRNVCAEKGCDPDATTKITVYILDLGKGVFEADLLLHHDDDPSDPGCMQEAQCAKDLNKTVVWWRTDDRTELGPINDGFKGAHFFPPMLADVTVVHDHTAINDTNDCNSHKRLILTLLQAIETASANLPCVTDSMQPDVNFGLNSKMAQVRNWSEALFQGLNETAWHTYEGMETIVTRVIDLKLNETAMPIRMASPATWPPTSHDLSRISSHKMRRSMLL